MEEGEEIALEQGEASKSLLGVVSSAAEGEEIAQEQGEASKSLLDVVPSAPSSALKPRKSFISRHGYNLRRNSHIAKVRIQQPFGEKKAQGRLLRRLGIIKRGIDGKEVDEEVMDKCMETLKESFPPSLVVAVLCGSDRARGPNGELWDISALDVVF
ncbi:hypothetical protein ACP4OV_013783 [Aristida adscensionis]